MEQRIENENVESHQSTPEEQTEPNNETIARPVNLSDMDILQNIRPIPIQTTRRSTRRRKPQKSEILTRSPIVTAQKQKQDPAAIKRKLSFDEPGPSGKKRQRRTKQNSKKPMTSYLCTVCKEKHIDSPVEDWIQCGGSCVKSGHMKPVLHIWDAVHIFAMTALINMNVLISIRFARPEYSFCPL